MWFSSWLGKRQRSSPSGRRHRSPGKRPTFRPRLEALEDRWLPSQVGLTVNSLADSGPGTLRAAIQTADAGSPSDKFTIGFSVTGTIDLQSPLPDLNNTIAIQGPGASSLTVERATGFSFASAIVTVDAGQTASLSGLTVANGNEGGIFNNGGTLTVVNSAVVNNVATNNDPFGALFGVGGGILNFGGSLTVSGSTISGNSASIGGGILSEGSSTSPSSLTVSGSAVSGNSAPGASFNNGFHLSGDGGGIWGFHITVSGCTISCNSTDGDGGGIETGGATISGCTLCGNSAFLGGGIDDLGFSTISSCTLSGNSALAFGGGLRADFTTVSGCTFKKNSATGFTQFGLHFSGSGGAISIPNFQATVRDSSFISNSAELGGAIDNDFGTLTVSDCTFTSNSATQGGAIYNTNFATLDVRGSTFTGNNTASDSGGGLYNLGTATLQECSLSKNIAGSAGGGIFNGASGALTVKDSTVLSNVAPLGADLYNLGALTLDDSTVGVIGP
jgi:predicted outer membrane repeat protein